MVSKLADLLSLSEKSVENLIYTLSTIIIFIIIRIITNMIIRRNVKDEKRSYNLLTIRE